MNLINRILRICIKEYQSSFIVIDICHTTKIIKFSIFSIINNNLQNLKFFKEILYLIFLVNIKMENQQLREQPAKLPATYFDLIERVGSQGKYQFILLIIFTLMWYIVGVLLMSTAFLFWNKPFDCIQHGLLVQSCKETVCSLPREDWNHYLDQDHTFESLATSFDEYFCDDEQYLDFASSSVYFGAFIGYLLFSFFSDNYGRRTSILLSWGCATIGSIILATSVNIYMAALGLFLAGGGGDAAINICFYFFSEVVGDEKRQKYSVIIQFSFSFGAVFVTLLFYLFQSWRYVVISTITIPAVLTFIAIFLLVEQTPQFLLRKDIQIAIASLNRIGKFNNIEKAHAICQDDIKNVMFQQVEDQEFQKVITPLDMIRFPSLRQITICCSVIAFCLYAMYYGPILIVDSIGFDIYTSNIILQSSDIICYLPVYLLIERLPRKKYGIILYAICGVCAAMLVFIQKPEDCNQCSEVYMELILVFIFRFCISFYFAIFNLFSIQLYPARARALGVGIVSAVGTIASSSSPIYLGILKRNNINVMIIFMIFSILGIMAISLLQQTLDVPLKEEIDEIALQKNKRKTTIINERQKTLSGVLSGVHKNNFS